MLPPRVSKADIHLLYVFTTVVEARSFSAAQAILNTSPSTISRQISDLENRLGGVLCKRGRAGFSVTEFGERVVSAARELFGSLEQFDTAIKGEKKTLVGKLSVGVIDNWISNAKAPIVATLSHFHDQAPEVEIDIHSMAPDALEYSLLDGRLDVGIGVFHKLKKGLNYTIISREYVDLYCGAGHPLFFDLSEDRLQTALPDANLVRRAYLTEEKVAPIALKTRSTSQAHQVEGVAMLILTGKFIGYLPQSYASAWVREGKMKSVADQRFALPTDIQLATKSGGYSSRVLERFISILELESAKQA